MNKFLLPLVAFVFGSAPAWSAIGDTATIDGVTYVVSGTWPSSDNKQVPRAAVTGVDAALTSVVLPASVEINGTSYDVTILTSGTSPFAENTTLTSVDLSAITPVKMQNAATSGTVLTGSLFKNCSELQMVVLPESLDWLSSYMFQGCSKLENVNLHETKVTKFNGGTSAFEGCSSLETVNFPSTFAGELSSYVFRNCTALTSVNTGELAVTAIGSGAFSGCIALKSLDIPVTVTSIGSNAFQNSGLETVDMSGNYSKLTKIDNTAFNGCSNLMSLDLTGVKNVTTAIPSFKNCSKLKTVRLGGSGFTTAVSDCFAGTAITTIGNAGSGADLEFGASLKTMGNNMFKGCVSLVTADLAEMNAALASNVFYGCTALQRVVMPASMPITVEMGNAGSNSSLYFNGCTALTEVVMPTVATEILHNMFNGLVSLKRVVMTAPLKKIGASAFKGCTALDEFHFGDALEFLGLSAFSGCTALKEVVLPNSMTELEGTNNSGSQFSDCTNLTTLVLPQNSAITQIPAYFVKNTALTSIVIPANYTSYGNYPFHNCKSLTSVDMSACGIKEFDSYLFQGCNALADVKLPQVLETLGNSALTGRANLTQLVLPETLTTIGSSALSATGLTSIVIPASVNSIAGQAFNNCKSLASVDMSACAVEEITSAMFSGCTNIEEFLLPRGLKTLGSSALYGRSKLTHIEFPETLTTIGSSALSNTGLTSIVIPWSVSSIESSAFSNCKATTLVIESYPEKPEASVKADGDDVPGADEELLVVGSQAFNTATMVDGVVCHRLKVPQIENNTFSNATYKKPLYIPWGMHDAYYQVDEEGKPYGWGLFGNEITGIGEVAADGAADVIVNAVAGTLTVSGAEGMDVKVFSTDGRMVYRGGEGMINLPGGIYIVNVGSRVEKVRL